MEPGFNLSLEDLYIYCFEWAIPLFIRLNNEDREIYHRLAVEPCIHYLKRDLPSNYKDCICIFHLKEYFN